MKHTRSKNTERGIINPNGIIIEGDIALSTRYDAGKDRMLLLRTVLCVLAATFTMNILGSFIGAETITALPVIMTALSFAALCAKNTMLKIYGIGYLLFQVSYFVIMRHEIITGIKLGLVRYQRKAEINFFSKIASDLSKMHLRQEEIDYYLFHAMMFIAAIVTVLVALSCILRTDFPVFFISTFPFLEIGLFFGWNPPSVSAVGLVVCWVAMLSLAMLNHSTNKAGINNTFAVHRRKEAFFFTSRKYKNRFFSYYLSGLAIVCAAVFAVSMVFSAITGFVRPKAFDELRRNITQFANDIPDMVNNMIDNLFNRPKEVGVTNGGKLGEKDKIDFNNNVALDIQVSRVSKGTLYLRGFVGGDYGSNEWTPIKPYREDEDELENAFDTFTDGQPIQNLNYLNFKSFNIDKALTTTISLYNGNADNRFIYAPYMADYLSLNMTQRSKPEGEGSVKPTDSTYMMDFYDMYTLSDSWDEPFGIIDILSPYRNSDNALNSTYLDFVNRYYRDISESDALEKVYQAIYKDLVSNYPYGVKDLNNRERIVASAISDYLSANYRYTLSPGSSKGKDFLEYFLEDHKEGYCTYFATAGTMLMRRFGYPARYVEGFIVTPLDYSPDKDGHIHAQVTDRAAHAWCEAFIEGVGWVPLEFTPGYQHGNNPNDPKKPTTTTTRATTTTTTASKASMSNITSASGATSAGSSAVTTTTSASKTGSASKNGSGGPNGEEDKPNAFFAFLKASFVYILILAATIVIFIIHRGVKLRKQRDLTEQEDRAKAFLWIYMYYLKYLELIGISDDSNISDEAQASNLKSKCRKNGIDSIIPDISFLSSLSIEIHLSRSREVSEEEHRKALSALNTLKNDIVPERLSFIGRSAAKWLYGLY